MLPDKQHCIPNNCLFNTPGRETGSVVLARFTVFCEKSVFSYNSFIADLMQTTCGAINKYR
jgi:hypothetical protein